jgi:hypothetical protein
VDFRRRRKSALFAFSLRRRQKIRAQGGLRKKYHNQHGFPQIVENFWGMNIQKRA